MYFVVLKIHDFNITAFKLNLILKNDISEIEARRLIFQTKTSLKLSMTTI